MFDRPVIDVDEWRNEPVRHRYVNGRFEGTSTRFSFFPEGEVHQKRFSQYTLPAPSSAPGAEDTAENNILFGSDQGHLGRRAAFRDRLAHGAAAQVVVFTATVWMPPGAGKLVGTEWDFLGAGDYPVRRAIDPPAQRTVLSVSHTFPTPGTYDSVLRVTPHRTGDVDAKWARIANVDRVRVIVE